MSDDIDSPKQINWVRIGEHDVVPLDAILDSLKFMAKNIRNKSEIFDDIKTQLKNCGYDYWFGDNPDEWQLRKALAVAVNDAIQEKTEPVDKKTKQLNDQLYELLVKDKGTKTLLKRYLSLRCDGKDKKAITSPLVLAENFLRRGAARWVVENMIQRQFDVRWETSNGEPDDFTFYKLCNMENTTEHFKYITRQAHVKAALYKECCRKPKRGPMQLLYDLLDKPRNVLCPKVFVKTANGWKAWQANEEEPTEGEKKKKLFVKVNLVDSVSWIHESIRNFIADNADTQKTDDASLKKTLEKVTLYWAVVDESDFKPGNYGELELKPFSSSQVYVGKANNGILGRWMNDNNSHCKMMKKCLDNVRAMTTYDPSRLEGIQLVDARLALAKVRREKTALFVIKTFGDDLKKAKITIRKARQHLRSARGKEKKDEAKEDPNEAEDRLEDVKKSKPNRAKIIKDLERVEKSHRKGRKGAPNNGNIIPYNDYMMTWKPTDMRCGMNKN